MKASGLRLLNILAVLTVVSVAQANMVVTPWIPIFKGIDRAAGTNFPNTTFTNNGVVYVDSTLQAVNCLRIDLTDPDVQFFPTPRATNYIAESSETYALSLSNFVKKHSLQVATTANFYNTSQGTDPSIEGVPSQVFGLSISTGQVVSVPDFGPDSNNRYASLLFTTNKVPYFVWPNPPPGTNTAGIYNAMSGYYAVLTNGVIIGGTLLSQTFPDSTFHQLQPRTLFGLSADRRYFYMMIIDGRQNGYSQGANDNDMGIWLVQFGASDGIAMDGGGSTAMYMADCGGGDPKPLGHSSYVAAYGRERITGSQLGVYAQPLPAFVNNVVAIPGSTAATITWNTDSNATSQVEYGLTQSYGTFSPLDSTLVTSHSVTLNGLLAGKKYFFRVLSIAGGTQYSSVCSVSSFNTTNIGVTLAFELTNDWKYNITNLDGVNWQATNYNDAGWSHGPGALWADSRPGAFPSPNAVQIPNYTNGLRMPIDLANPGPYPYLTYYFRTKFIFPGPTAGASLIFSNFLDDGAVFYLNGAELYRANMPGGAIVNSTPSSMNPCGTGNATCPALYTITGNTLSNLVVGTNVVAVEVHNQVFNSPDITFETALFYVVQPPAPIITNVVAAPGETNVTITWITTTNATTQVQYGLTPALGSSNTLAPALVTNHSVSLNGLQPLTTYYFRVLSTAGGNSFSADGTFATVPFQVPLVSESNLWKYTTNNLDGTNWMATNYNDSAWLGQGLALLYIEDNQGVSPRSTALPGNANGLPFRTYYFRTHFTVSNSLAGLALLFTNFIDDGAVFYLNGAEVQRVHMPSAPQSITYATLANDCPINSCDATVDVPDVFRLSGDALTNVVVGGDNVLAAEVHQFTTNDTDVVFGSTLALVRALVTETKLRVSRATNTFCISWNGDGFTLQRASVLTGTNAWSDVPGPIKISPYCTTNPPATTFYRLRN